MKIFPWAEVVANAEAQIAKGHTVYQQFNCEHCGAKQTMEAPNTFHRIGQCEECSWITDIEKHGMNFMMVSMLTTRGTK